jgi:hypothetical protein
MEHKRVSELTGVTHFRDIPVTQKQVDEWKASGQHIQNYFPQLSAEDREFLLTGITPEEWGLYMGEPEDDYDLDPEDLDTLLEVGAEIFVERRDDR